MFDLSNKKALVTGGSRGIGTKIAQAFIQRGAQVIITGTNEEKLKEIANIAGKNCSYVVADLSQQQDIENLINNHCQDLDILVNNAGITKDNLLLRMKDQDWQQVLDVNLSAAYKLIRGSIRGMLKKRSGRIINLSSVVAASGNPGQANYCAAKAGIVGMSKSIALEIAARGITVNCISPGFIQTDMTNKLTEEQVAQITKNIPSGKMGQVDDIANAAIFLASDEASYITGQNLHINGGLYLAN
ncbi:MAG: 3-oxoacyl-[acyl-carrier-protein] reductase [Rickettsiales bacterium]